MGRQAQGAGRMGGRGKTVAELARECGDLPPVSEKAIKATAAVLANMRSRLEDAGKFAGQCLDAEHAAAAQAIESARRQEEEAARKAREKEEREVETLQLLRRIADGENPPKPRTRRPKLKVPKSHFTVTLLASTLETTVKNVSLWARFDVDCPLTGWHWPVPLGEKETVAKWKEELKKQRRVREAKAQYNKQHRTSRNRTVSYNENILSHNRPDIEPR